MTGPSSALTVHNLYKADPSKARVDLFFAVQVTILWPSALLPGSIVVGYILAYLHMTLQYNKKKLNLTIHRHRLLEYANLESRFKSRLYYLPSWVTVHITPPWNELGQRRKKRNQNRMLAEALGVPTKNLLAHRNFKAVCSGACSDMSISESAVRYKHHLQ